MCALFEDLTLKAHENRHGFTQCEALCGLQRREKDHGSETYKYLHQREEVDLRPGPSTRLITGRLHCSEERDREAGGDPKEGDQIFPALDNCAFDLKRVLS